MGFNSFSIIQPREIDIHTASSPERYGLFIGVSNFCFFSKATDAKKPVLLIADTVFLSPSGFQVSLHDLQGNEPPLRQHTQAPLYHL